MEAANQQVIKLLACLSGINMLTSYFSSRLKGILTTNSNLMHHDDSWLVPGSMHNVGSTKCATFVCFLLYQQWLYFWSTVSLTNSAIASPLWRSSTWICKQLCLQSIFQLLYSIVVCCFDYWTSVWISRAGRLVPLCQNGGEIWGNGINGEQVV